MSLIPWRPFHDMEHWFEDEFWPAFPRLGWPEIRFPRTDVYETEKAVVAELEVPEIDPEKVDISVEGNVLRVRGESEKKEEERGKDYYRKEIRRGAFQRAVALPSVVKEEGIDATYEDGVLKIVMPKEKPTKEEKRKIKIKVKAKTK